MKINERTEKRRQEKNKHMQIMQENNRSEKKSEEHKSRYMKRTSKRRQYKHINEQSKARTHDKHARNENTGEEMKGKERK